jgi:ankyrin repeat protein
MFDEMSTDKLRQNLSNQENQLEIIKKLLHEGADPNTVGKWGSGLFLASMHHDYDMWNLFVKHKADPTMRNEIGDTVLHAAVKSTRIDGGKEMYFFSSMLHYCKPILEFEDERGITALSSASSISNDLFKMRILLEMGANPNVKDTQGCSPLIQILNTKSDERSLKLSLVYLLLSKGADVNATGKNRIPPLLMAILDSDTILCKLFLDNGANVNAKVGRDVTLLQIALSSKNVQIREFFQNWIDHQHKKTTCADIFDVPNAGNILES